MSGEGLDPLKRYIVKGIAAGVGLASESITSYKERRKASSSSPPSSENDTASIRSLPTSTDTSATSVYELPADPKTRQDEDAQWELDEAQDELLPQYEQQQETSSTSDLGQDLINRYPAPAYTEIRGKLSQPVILPQRRPKTRRRGFIRAYAPALNDTGITQEMFLDFLETFHKSTQASPWIDAINYAAMPLSLIPHFPMVVGLAIQATLIVAKDIQNRTRTNAFLDKANNEFFGPRGLYCLIMTYSPETDKPHESADVSSTIAATQNPSTSQKMFGKLKESKGKTYGEIELPEAAPLVFPILEDPAAVSDAPKSTKEKLEGTQNYVREYFDKRAQAKFAAKNDGSSLVQGQTPKFTSRYADPTHPASSGSFRSLITGGHINPPPMTRQERMAGAMGNWCSSYDARQPGAKYTLKDHVSRTRGMMSLGAPRGEHAPYGGQPAEPAMGMRPGLGSRMSGDRDKMQVGPLSVPSPGAMVKKVVKKNILYLMVVNVPTDEELAQAAEELEKRRKEGAKLSNIVKRFSDY
ncbi:hypothetical protein BHE90_005887 [Fusarium euwallaceae]|uniref:Uncharacterized protein n=1 Tax=Fusarium euwallaceae TaxID=1147111 RepID=A0A430LV78_9HYPO|nr:hypothetical protein BHE90_005887 [Fusarium euwallaceae]